MIDCKKHAYEFLARQIKRTRISMGVAEMKPNSQLEIRRLKEKIDILEYLQELVLKEKT